MADWRRILMGLGLVLVIAALAIGWGITLRQKVTQQTSQLEERYQHEALLRARFPELFENANDIILTLDLSGLITAVNRAGQRALGRPRLELPKRRWVDRTGGPILLGDGHREDAVGARDDAPRDSSRPRWRPAGLPGSGCPTDS